MTPRLAACLLLPLLLCGCLHRVQIPRVSLSASEPSWADETPGSLGVVPFADLRPKEEKRGKEPWLVPLIIWNQRTGRYVTSSEHFGGDVSGDVSRAVADALSGWRFGRAYVLPVEPGSSVAEHCDRGLDYVADGEIHHLYGAVRQRAWLFILPTPWIAGMLSGNQVGDPVGVVRMTLRIHDCRSGERIVSRRFISEGVFQRLSASAAAQRAFDQMIHQVADLSRAGGDAPTLGEVDPLESESAEAPPPEPARPPKPPRRGDPSPAGEPDDEPNVPPAEEPEQAEEGEDGEPELVPL